jgi:hypothetical protein
MGTQGWLRVSPVSSGGGGIVALRRTVLATVSLTILGIVGGCSASPPWSSANAPPNGGQAAVAPAPNYTPAAAGQPAYVPPPGQQAYTPPPAQQVYTPPPGQPTYAPPPGQQAYAPPPGQSAYAPPPGQQAYAPPPNQQAYAQPQAPQQEPGTVGSMRQSYAGFISMFRDQPDPDPNAQPGYDSRTSVRSPPPVTSGAPPQNAYVPHPPSTYTASQQPYAPPQGQPASPPPQQN